MIILAIIILSVILYYIVRIGVRDGAIDAMKSHGTLVEDIKRELEKERKSNIEFSKTVDPYNSEEWRNY